MKRAVAGTLLVLALAPLVAFGAFISKVYALERHEFEVLAANIAEADRSAAGLDTVLSPLECSAESLRSQSQNKGKAFFGFNQVATLIRGVRGEFVDQLWPSNLPVTALPFAIEYSTRWRLAKAFVLDPPPLKDLLLELEFPTVRQIGTKTTDLFAIVVPVPHDGLLRVEVRRYPTGEVLCRGTLEAPEKLDPRNIHDTVSSALSR